MAGTLNVKLFERAPISEQVLRESTPSSLRDLISQLRGEHDLIVGSVSLGSSRRDKVVSFLLGDYRCLVFRKGTDGDFSLAESFISELDGLVDAIGLGGIDLYIRVGDEVFTIADALPLKERAKESIVVDGSGLKDSLERRVIEELTREGLISPPMKVLMVSAVDRWGMAETFWRLGYRCLYGDLIFSFGLNYPISTLRDLERLGKFVLRYVTKLPFELLYPVGERQHKRPKSSKFSVYYQVADIVAGDFHYLIKYMPEDMSGKVVITNTLTSEDIEDLRRRGVRKLITTTPKLGGRSFGTNVMEGLLASYSLRAKGRPPKTRSDYEELIDELGIRYTIIF